MIAVIFGPFYNQDCSHIWTSTEPILQSYMNPSKTRIAVIFGPFKNQDCSHIWTLLKLRLQSYLDPNMSDIALIIGPPPIQRTRTLISYNELPSSPFFERFVNKRVIIICESPIKSSVSFFNMFFEIDYLAFLVFKMIQ